MLAIGAARYAFLAAGWLLPWMRAPLPPRYWRKVVAATQGIVLTVAAADVLPLALTQAALVAALALLGESFGRDVVVALAPPARASVSLRSEPDPVEPHDAGPDADACGRHRRGAHDPRRSARLGRPRRAERPEPSHARARSCGSRSRASSSSPWPSSCPPPLGASWPGSSGRLLGSARHREAPRHRLLHGLRPAVRPRRRLELRRDRHRDAARVGRADEPRTWPSSAWPLLVVAVLVLTTLAVLRLTRVAAGHRRTSLRAVMALGAVWALCWAFGAQLVSGAPIASTSAAGLAVDEVRAVRAGMRDRAIFADEIAPRPLPHDARATGC